MSRLPYPHFLLFNAAGGILWALTYGWLGAAFGSQWPLIQLWAGRAGLLMLGMLVLVALAVLLGRWAIRHEARLRARGAALRFSRKFPSLALSSMLSLSDNRWAGGRESAW